MPSTLPNRRISMLHAGAVTLPDRVMEQMVQDLAASMAAVVNKAGRTAQLRYILSQVGLDEGLQLIQEAVRELDEGEAAGAKKDTNR